MSNATLPRCLLLKCCQLHHEHYKLNVTDTRNAAETFHNIIQRLLYNYYTHPLVFTKYVCVFSLYKKKTKINPHSYSLLLSTNCLKNSKKYIIYYSNFRLKKINFCKLYNAYISIVCVYNINVINLKIKRIGKRCGISQRCGVGQQ